MPLLVRRYSTFGLPPTELFIFWRGPLLSYGALAVAYAWMGRKDKKSPLFPLGVCALGSLANAFGQAKGWDYHLIPAQFFLFTGFAAFAHAALKNKKGYFLFLAGLALLGGHSFLNAKYWPEGVSEKIRESCHGAEIVANSHPVEKILNFTFLVPCSFPLFNEQDYRLGSRYLFLFPLVFFNHSPARAALLADHYPRERELGADEIEFVANLREDIRKVSPDLLVFPVFEAESLQSPHGPLLPAHFDTYLYAKSTGIITERDSGYRAVYSSSKLKIFRKITP
jgi:hypothetical protein